MKLHTNHKNFVAYGVLGALALILIGTAFSTSSNSKILSSFSPRSQLSSVASANGGVCYLTSDISVVESQKMIADDMLNNSNAQLTNIETTIIQTVDSISLYTTELQNLRDTGYTEESLVQERTNIEIAERRLSELQNPSLSTGMCSAEGYYTKEDCETAGYYMYPYCTGGPMFSDQESCENAGYSYGGGCSNSVYTDQTSCLNATNETWNWETATSGYCTGGEYSDETSCLAAGYYSGGGCSNSTYTTQQECINASYTSGGYCSGGSSYGDEFSCVNAGATQGYCSGGAGYTDESSCLSVGTTPGYCSNNEITDEYSCINAVCASSVAYCSNAVSKTYTECINSGATWYGAQPTSCSSCGYTWTPPTTTEYGYSWYQENRGYGYQWIPSENISYGYTWSEPSFTSYGYSWNQNWYSNWIPSYTNSNTWSEPVWVTYGYVWDPGMWYSNNYVWTSTDTETERQSLLAQIDELKAIYNQHLAEAEANNKQIISIENTIASLKQTLVEQTTQKANVKADTVQFQARADELNTQFISYISNKCPDMEADCSNASDDDGDGAMDCSDADCSGSSVCTGDTTIIIDNEQNQNGGIWDTILNILTGGSATTNLIPIADSVPAPVLSSRFMSISSLLRSNIASMGQQNDTVIVPAMKQIEAKVSDGEYDELPALIDTAKPIVNNAQLAIDSYFKDAASLGEENELTTADPEVKAEVLLQVITIDNLLKDYKTYFNTLEGFLTGDAPSPAQYSALNENISALKNSGNAYESESSKLRSLIDTKQTAQQKVVALTSVSPSEGELVSYYSYIDHVTIQFNKPIQKYLGGTIVVHGPSLNTINNSMVDDSMSTVYPGDTSVSASFLTPMAGQTYTVVADLQLQFEGKAYRLKKTWQFSIERDPTEIVRSQEELDAEEEQRNNQGLSEEEKCEKKKGFWSRLFGGSCKQAADICCLCIYGDTGTEGSNNAQTFVKSCTDQIAENKCTSSSSRYTPTIEDQVDAETAFPSVCPSDKYDDVRFLRSIHGFDKGNEGEVCENIPKSLIDGYAVGGGDIPTNITVDSQACNDFDSMTQAEQYANNLKDYLNSKSYDNVSVTIRANQNNVAFDGVSGRTYLNSCSRATFVVCSSSVQKQLNPCPSIGTDCVYGEGTSNTMQCDDEDGREITRECVDSGRRNKYDQVLGSWK